MGGTISEQDQAWMNYIGNGGSMEPSDTFDAGWDAALTRINQLERQCAVLAAEIDKQRPVVEAARRVVVSGGAPARLVELSEAVHTYERPAEEDGYPCSRCETNPATIKLIRMCVCRTCYDEMVAEAAKEQDNGIPTR